MKVIKLVHPTTAGPDLEEEMELDDLDVAIALAEDMKKAKERAALNYEVAQNRVIELMDERDEKTWVSPLNGGWQATLVQAERVVYDEAKLLNEVSPSVRKKISKTTLDRAKLADAVSKGVVSVELLAECSSVVPNKPFIKLTEHREQEPEEQA